MADLGFLLLVFFVVTTTFAVAEEGISLVLPGRTSSTTRVSVSDVLEIRALADGTIQADGGNIAVASVRPLVMRRLAANPDLVVLLATDRKAPYGLMIDLLDEVKLAKCRRISLKTVE